jgi:hypothetical protein
VVGVEQQQERVVDQRLAALGALLDAGAVEEHADHVRVVALPVDVVIRRPSGGTTRRRAARSPRPPRRAGSACGGTPGAPAQLDEPAREAQDVLLVGSQRLQSNHEMSLSWHHALLLPPCERLISSPPSSIGVPSERNSVARKLRCWRARSVWIIGSSVGPSTPQFHERLSSVPSRLPSLLASLCLSW